MQDDDLFAKRPPDNEHRLDQHRQVGEVLNKLPDAGLKLHLHSGEIDDEIEFGNLLNRDLSIRHEAGGRHRRRQAAIDVVALSAPGRALRLRIRRASSLA
jgi:hypothetical protein